MPNRLPHTAHRTPHTAEDNVVVFVPKELVKSIDNVFGWMKEAHEEMTKVAEGMKIIDN